MEALKLVQSILDKVGLEPQINIIINNPHTNYSKVIIKKINRYLANRGLSLR
jgi:hypothetical protein